MTIALAFVIVVLLAACVALWLRSAIYKERVMVLEGRCSALAADKAMQIATVKGLRDELTRKDEVHRASLLAERKAAQDAAQKAEAVAAVIGSGDLARAADDALEGL